MERTAMKVTSLSYGYQHISTVIKINPPPMTNWRDFLKKYLASTREADISRCGVDYGALAPPVLRSVMHSDRLTIVALPAAGAADRLADDIEALSQLAEVPVRTLVIPEGGRGKLLFPGGESRRARALNAALSEEFDLVIGSVHALLGPAPPPRETREAALTLVPGLKISPAELAERLVTLDYDDEFEAGAPGEFARRGGIIDIFSPASDFPCRIEFFGDEIESLRSFSTETRRSTGAIDEYRVIGRAGITAGGAANSDAFEYFSDREFRLIVCNPDAAEERLRNYSAEAASARFERLRREAEADGRLMLLCDAVEGAGNSALAPADVTAPLREEAAADSEAKNAAATLALELLRREINSRPAGAVLFLAADAADAAALGDWLCERLPEAGGKCEVVVSGLRGGLIFADPPLRIVASGETMAAGFRRVGAADEEEGVSAPVEKTIPESELSLSSLDIGDYAVHVDFGIGIYRGIQTFKSGGVEREMIVLEYRDGKLLNVPLLSACKVSRYLGSAGRIALHALGGSRWKRDVDSAADGIHSYAVEMLRLQAVRQALPGISFPAGDRQLTGFLRAFPYHDTPDQRRATREIFRDMSAARPMDRLICGDVGYGKTELAMRAVFRAVSAGYQAAVIAPTTVLAQQHFNSFRERFAAYPFTIDMLSRFRTAAEQRQVIEHVASGGVDIVIGTHRLCGADVKFNNLGLVVIDEEQRFGVEHKETLRRFRTGADVLTMSATPIPRTLYLAMAGARDLSTLMSAPRLRQPVKTVIAPEEELLIVNAIRAELARGGQVYYLHNRVKTIDECADRLAALLPEARFAVAHGQLPEKQLEEIMSSFLAGNIDCLVCSTIIESGLDVPNANTIIIERADRFGLAELYQLRGRVGRWTHQAYAYLLLPRDRFSIGSDARKRLAAIRRCSNLGAGFQLALRDLEIRGSGNLLGPEQSGHLNLIGFDLYCRLLSQEVARLKNEEPVIIPEVEVSIDFIRFASRAPEEIMAASLPVDYIGGDRPRLELYRRLGLLGSEAALEELRSEIIDRFGPLPEPAENLLRLTLIRLLTAESGYRRLAVADGRVVLSNSSGGVFRLPDGKLPRLDYRDAPKLRLLHLEKYLRQAKK